MADHLTTLSERDFVQRSLTSARSQLENAKAAFEDAWKQTQYEAKRERLGHAEEFVRDAINILQRATMRKVM